MKQVVSPIMFSNNNGRRLFGMLHEPDSKIKTTAILLLSPGVKSRVAPHRMYIKMAERFCSLGFAVLRMDPEGLGDSEGDFDEELIADVYASIQLGRHIEDTMAMMDWLEKKAGISRFILAGLCGGAITALLTAEKDPRVHAILALGIPCVMSSSTADPTKYITQSQFNSIRHKYLCKILNREAWVRFLSFKTDYKLLLKSIFQPFRRQIRVLKKTTPVNVAPTNRDIQINSNLNPHFHRAFYQFITKNKMLMIFSGADRLYWEFEEKYMAMYGPLITAYATNYSIYIVKEANHVFSFKEWQEEMLLHSVKWLSTIDG